MNHLRSIASVFVTCSLLASSVARAGIVPLNNPSFESPTLSAGAPFVGSVQNWIGSYLGTALASSYGLGATNGAQVAYLQNSPGQNYVLSQATATPLTTATAYNLLADIRPLADDPANNCAFIQLTRTSFGIIFAQATYNSNLLKPFGFVRPNGFTLTSGQWTSAACGFDSRDYPADVTAGSLLQPLAQGYNSAIDNVRLYFSPNTYHISFSTGDDLNDGLTPATAWKTFTVINQMQLGPDDQVLLKRGDTWTSSSLNLTGKGAPGSPVRLGAYGDGPDPVITGTNLTTAACITLQNPSHFTVSNMDCRDAKIGLYLRYAGGNLDGTGAMFNNQSVTIDGCHFQNMDELWSDGSGNITVVPPYELSWGAGIWMGGGIPDTGGNPAPPSVSSLILNGLTIRNCGFQDCSTGFGNNWYFPRVHESRITNLLMEDCWVTGCENGSVALFYVDGGVVRRVNSLIGGNGYYSTGTTGGFAQHCRNLVVDNCEFAFNKRPSDSNDGTGFDWEGSCDNSSLTNCVIQSNDGGGILVLDSTSDASISGDNTNLQMNSNTIYNDCRAPKPGSSGQNKELRYPNTGSTGTFQNNGVYLGSNVGSGTVAAFDSTTRWLDFTGSGATRTATPYSAVSGRPSAWDFTADAEGWGAFSANWGSPAGGGGFLTGTSTGVDPYAESPATWINTRRNELLVVRMSQTAGAWAQVFFQTETDATWTPSKAVAFQITADGTMHEYLVDLSTCADYKGVVTQLRLDPTDANGSAMVIDKVQVLSNPFVEAIAVLDGQTIDLVLDEAMLPTGGVFTTANYTLSGTAQGTLAANPASVSKIVTPGGPVYRLQWTDGSLVAGTVTVTASGATDPLGFPIYQSPVSTSYIPAGVADWQLY